MSLNYAMLRVALALCLLCTTSYAFVGPVESALLSRRRMMPTTPILPRRRPCCRCRHEPSTVASVSIALHVQSKQGNEQEPDELSTRRRLLKTAGAIALAGGTSTTLIALSAPPNTIIASAATPISIGESENVGARTKRLVRTKPPKVLRNQLNIDFAVLLMRSSYNALDQLDCVAMDQFQRDFFILRQAEYLPYTKSLGPGAVQQGQLTDPYYFDFISFAQYATMNREITQDPPFVFEEQQPVDVGENEPQKFVTAVIRRDPALTNKQLAPEHGRRVGAAILDRLDETFGNTPSAIPKAGELNSLASVDMVLASFSQLVKLFLLNGYAWDGSAALVSPSSSSRPTAAGVEFCLSLSAPANVWGGLALQQQKAPLRNDFLLKTAKELATRMGYKVTTSAVKYEGTKELNYLTLG